MKKNHNIGRYFLFLINIELSKYTHIICNNQLKPVKIFFFKNIQNSKHVKLYTAHII